MGSEFVTLTLALFVIFSGVQIKHRSFHRAGRLDDRTIWQFSPTVTKRIRFRKEYWVSHGNLCIEMQTAIRKRETLD